MISNKLQHLANIATKMELLLKDSTKTYRAMYATLERDLDIALENIAQRMIAKYNIPQQTIDDTPYYDDDAPISDLETYKDDDTDEFEIPADPDLDSKFNLGEYNG